MKNLLKTFLFSACALVFCATGFVWQSATPAFGFERTEAGKARVLMEYGTGQILSEYNSTDHLPIASVTKLTTLLLTFEALEDGRLSLEQELVASKNAASMGGSQVFIDAGATYKVENLIHAIIISSANDASVMLAEELAGSEENFVQEMNKKVKSLGGQNTNYGNCTGLPCPTAYSSANDVALVMREVMQYPLYFEVSGIWMEDFAHPSGRVTQMANTNKLLRSYSGCDAGKTGSTSEAGFCMSATAKKGNMRLIAVVLGADNSQARFGTCESMLDYGFGNFESTMLLDSDEAIDTGLIISGAKNQSDVKPERSYYSLNKKGEAANMAVSFELDKVAAPLAKGSVVGKAIITKDNVVVEEIDLVLCEDVNKKSLWDEIHSIATEW